MRIRCVSGVGGCGSTTSGSFRCSTGGNVYFHGARGYYREETALRLPDANPKAEIVEEGERAYLRVNLDPAIQKAGHPACRHGTAGKSEDHGSSIREPRRVAHRHRYRLFREETKLRCSHGRTFRESGSGRAQIEGLVRYLSMPDFNRREFLSLAGAAACRRRAAPPQHRPHHGRRHGLLRHRLLRRRDRARPTSTAWRPAACASRSSTTRPAAAPRGRRC